MTKETGNAFILDAFFLDISKKHTKIIFQVWNSPWKLQILCSLCQESENIYHISSLRSDWHSFYIFVFYGCKKPQK